MALLRKHARDLQPTYRDRMRALREDSDLRQKDIAAVLHVCQHTYSDYETGKTRLPIDRMILLAEYYNVDLNYICGLTDRRQPYPSRKKKDSIPL